MTGANNRIRKVSDIVFYVDVEGNWRMGADKRVLLPIKKVIFSSPATVVIWDDGEKTVVKAHNEEFDAEKGLAMCIAERYFGNYTRFKKVIEENLKADDA